MGPTNEVLRQFVGKAVLLGFEALDYWNQTYNRRVVENEIKKLDVAGKRELAKELAEQADKDESRAAGRSGLAARMAVETAGRPLIAGLKPVDPAFESWWVRPGSATVVDLHGDDRVTVIDPGRRPAGRAHGAVPRRARGPRRARRRRRRPRDGRARAGGGRRRARLPRGAPRARPAPARRARDAPVRERQPSRLVAGVPRRARRDRDRGRAGRPAGGRRPALVGARGGGQARHPAARRPRWSCRRRWPSRGSTSAWTWPRRCPTRCAPASTSR